MLNGFIDPDFIPDTPFCDNIDDNSPLIILKHPLDGRICNWFFSKKETNYLECMKQTNNKFLKLAFFEYLKGDLPDSEQYKIMNSEGLIPLYYEVAVNIVKQVNQRYRPMWLVKEYIKIAHKSPTISDKEMFHNVGNLLTLIIDDGRNTHLRDIFFILKDFLNLKKKILTSGTISSDVYRAIDYWINDIFDGNLSEYDYTKHLLARIFEFFKGVNLSNKNKNSRMEIIFRKYKQFYDEKLDDSTLYVDNIQSIHVHQLFTESMLEITQKYCVDEEIKGKIVSSLKAKFEKLQNDIQIAMESLPLITGEHSISSQEIEEALKPFKKDSLPEFLHKIVVNDWFIPEIPEISSIEDQDSTRFFPTIVHDGATRHYESGNPIVTMTLHYKMSVSFSLTCLQHKLKDYDKYDLLGNLFAIIHFSDLIDDLSKRMFFTSLEYYGRGDFFLFIQTSIFQIERILRTLCKKKGIYNLFTDEKKTHPKGLDYMIRQLKEKKVLSTKFLLFIDWLLSGSSETIIPENLRNKIAHGIDDMENFNIIYNENNALSIILIYLSLSKS